MDIIRQKKSFFTVACFLLCACLILLSCRGENGKEKADEPDKFNPEEVQSSFEEMNKKLYEAIKLGKDIEKDINNNKTVDKKKLKKLQDLIKEIKHLKYKAARNFPLVFGKSFYYWYRQYVFIDDIADYVYELGFLFYTSNTPEDRAKFKKLLFKWLDILKKEKEYLETMLPKDKAKTVRDSLSLINEVIKKIIEGINKKSLSFKDFQRLVNIIRNGKRMGMLGLPNIYGLSFEIWYLQFYFLDGHLKAASEFLDGFQGLNKEKQKKYIKNVIGQLSEAKESKEIMHEAASK